MEKRDRKPGYFARLKRRRQLKQSQSEKNVAEQNPGIISCPDIPNDSDPNRKKDLQRITEKPTAGSDDGSESKNQSKREKKRPPGTVDFIVGPDDSLISIALKFNITPNKLVQLNKLFSRSVYPGQKLFVPDVSQSETDLRSLSSSDPSFTNGVSEKASHVSRKEFIMLLRYTLSKSLRRELSPNSEDESPATVKFIKMSCKYFTDGMGVVGGVLIVTPNNIMFDPHKSDPLVIELGCEEYGLICPMEEVVSVALYNDVSRMKLKDALPSICVLCTGPGEWEQLPSERDLNPFSRYEALDPKRPIVLDDMESTLSETGNLIMSSNVDCKWSFFLILAVNEITPKWCKIPPMFLCFKVGKPMRKSFATGMTSSPAYSFGGRGKQPEYWFAVPQERVDHLYAFFVQWSPHVYGKEAREQGFVVVEKDELDMIDNFFSDPASCSWEIITIDEAKRRQSFSSCDGELPVDALPMLSDASDVLQDTHIEKLACRLPARVQIYPWRLAYSTVKHGTSLKTLYRSLADVDSPVLLVIKDMDNQIFGAFSTHPFKVSEHCYGTGETFLYSFCPEIKVYRWTGENSYFVKGNTDSLQMGGGGGQLGLWLDAELYRGTTTKCATFNNQPLSAQQDFNIHSVEVWTFE
uniref:Nuclear receptor coactivator 7 n=1 Tax=Sander lucioperca TaxID=283035 RepID=A0A8D0ARA3_SANLU